MLCQLGLEHFRESDFREGKSKGKGMKRIVCAAARKGHNYNVEQVAGLFVRDEERERESDHFPKGRCRSPDRIWLVPVCRDWEALLM